MCFQNMNCYLKVVPQFTRNSLIYVFSICHTTATHAKESVSGRKSNLNIQFEMICKNSVAVYVTSTYLSDKRILKSMKGSKPDATKFIIQ